MSKIRLTDVTLRDGHQSLFATRMLTSDMLPIASKLDAAGFWSLEVWGGATFDTCIRFLNEDPWERLRQLKRAMPHTPLQMLLRGQNLLGYRHYADDVVEAFVAHAASTGVDVFRVFDALNDARNLETAMRAVKKSGKHAQAAISYAVTPVHTVDSYVKLAVAMQRMGADSICIKDMAGLLRPYEAEQLVRALRKAVALPIQVHSHATTGLAVASLVKAVEAGAEYLDVAISSMAMGTSHPPAETIVETFRGTEWDTGLDMHLLTDISAYFRNVRRRYRSDESAFLGADTRILVSQIPGGMMSNLESQLKEHGAEGKMDDVLTEIAVLQQDFGYPPLVTPTSQIVGTQAVMNVLFGRYKRLTQESMNLLAGKYGSTPASPNSDLVRRALTELGASAPVKCRPADDIPAEMEKLEKELCAKLGTASVSREDVLTYAMFPQVAMTFFKSRDKGPVKMEEPSVTAEVRPAAGIAAPCTATIGSTSYRIDRIEDKAGVVSVEIGGKAYAVKFGEAAAGNAPAAQPKSRQEGSVPVTAPMAGTIVQLTHGDGDKVAKDETILTMEALKMQMEIKSVASGVVRYLVKPQDSVKDGTILAEVV